MSTVGGYDLHCYCDHPAHDRWQRCVPATFGGRTERDALREAREAGWRFFKENAPADSVAGGKKAYCAACARRA